MESERCTLGGTSDSSESRVRHARSRHISLLTGISPRTRRIAAIDVFERTRSHSAERSRVRPRVLDHDRGRAFHCTPLGLDCLEGMVPFMRRQAGWMPAGGTYVVGGELGTLDEYLKDCISRQTSRWVAVVLREAGVVRIDQGPPLRVQLTERFK
jgi:hypothetical protein